VNVSGSVDFIIVAFRNAAADIESLASSLRRHTHGGRIILVANDDEEYAVPSDSTILQGHGNVGFAAGVQLGVLHSDAEFLVVVNPDCVVTDVAVSRFVDRLRPGCGILVPKLLTAQGDFDYYPYENWTYSIGRKVAEARCRRQLAVHTDESLPSFAKIPGAFVGLERSVAIDLDCPFDSAFFLYAEDRDLTDRVRRKNIPIRYLADVEVTHIGGQSGTSVSQLVEICKTDGSMRVASRRYGRLGVALYAMDTLILGVVKRLFRRPLDARAHRTAIGRWWGNRLADPGPLTSDGLQQMTGSLAASSKQTSNAVNLRPRVLVMWADNSAANLGLRVLASGNAALLTQASGEALDVDYQDFGPGDSLVSFGTRSILRDIGRRNGPIKTKLRGYTMILDTGAGDSFADIYGFKRLAFIAYAHWMMRRLHLPLVLGPQTIGPFNTVIGRMIARRSLRQAALVMTRDDASAKYAEQTLGRRVDVVGTDVVFMLPTSAQPTRSRDVILNVSGLLWFGDDHVDSQYYREQVRSFVEAIESSGRTVSLLAHVVNSSQGNDDIDAIKSVASTLSRPDIELLIPRDLGEARSYIASGTFLVGARMHACLNALSQGVPAIPWAYSRKFEPLLSAVGWPHVLDLRSGGAIGRQSAQMILDAETSRELEARAMGVTTMAHEAVETCVDALSQWLPDGLRALPIRDEVAA
jgi:colanic acid/amylovoran biosynthesis protein WcaK/AmsJ